VLPRTSDANRSVPKTASSSLRHLSDEELLEGIRRSEQAHFNELYERYFSRIYGFVYTRLRNHADAEEIVQETFTAVFRSLGSFRGQSSLLSWIYGIAKNTVNNAMRRSRTAGQRMDAIDPELLSPRPSIATIGPDEQLNLRRFADSINDRLESLAEWQSEVFLMRHVEDLSIREICERTSRSSDAIRSSLYRVKRLLIEDSGVALAPAGS